MLFGKKESLGSVDKERRAYEAKEAALLKGHEGTLGTVLELLAKMLGQGNADKALLAQELGRLAETLRALAEIPLFAHAAEAARKADEARGRSGSAGDLATVEAELRAVLDAAGQVHATLKQEVAQLEEQGST